MALRSHHFAAAAALLLAGALVGMLVTLSLPSGRPTPPPGPSAPAVPATPVFVITQSFDGGPIIVATQAPGGVLMVLTQFPLSQLRQAPAGLRIGRGSAPASNAVFRARAEDFLGTEFFLLSDPGDVPKVPDSRTRPAMPPAGVPSNFGTRPRPVQVERGFLYDAVLPRDIERLSEPWNRRGYYDLIDFRYRPEFPLKEPP